MEPAQCERFGYAGIGEVVVVGYGTMKKRDLTGAITSVKSEDVVMNPSSNPMQALQGKVAGLDITRESGQAGSGVKMQLRGNRVIPERFWKSFIYN